MKIAKDHAVFFDYEVRNSRSELLDSSERGGPMAYVHGYASIIPGLERALEGKAVGDELSVVVPPVEAYGLRDEKRMGTVDRSIFPEGTEIKPGMRFRATSEHGTDSVVVVGVTDNSVTVDANHPLAGETLSFKVAIREIRPASAEEIAHGHVHHAHEHGHGGCCGGHGHDHSHDQDDAGCGDGGCGCH